MMEHVACMSPCCWSPNSLWRPKCCGWPAEQSHCTAAGKLHRKASCCHAMDSLANAHGEAISRQPQCSKQSKGFRRHRRQEHLQKSTLYSEFFALSSRTHWALGCFRYSFNPLLVMEYGCCLPCQGFLLKWIALQSSANAVLTCAYTMSVLSKEVRHQYAKWLRQNLLDSQYQGMSGSTGQIISQRRPNQT